MVAAIQATGLKVSKGELDVLKGLEISVKRGSLTGLIGPSGSGKTTLMRAIIGVQQVSGGTLQVFGKKAGSKELRKQIGYVTQKPSVYPDLTVKQNLRYFAKIVQAHSKDVDKVIAQVRLEEQCDQLAQSLSGGQLARVSLAAALLGNPDLLVFDEPTVGLDPLLRNELWQLFKEMASNGKTLLISSHVMDEAERCEDVILLRDGGVLWNDSKVRLLEATKMSSVGAAFETMITKAEAK